MCPGSGRSVGENHTASSCFTLARLQEYFYLKAKGVTVILCWSLALSPIGGLYRTASHPEDYTNRFTPHADRGVKSKHAGTFEVSSWTPLRGMQSLLFLSFEFEMS